MNEETVEFIRNVCRIRSMNNCPISPTCPWDHAHLTSSLTLFSPLHSGFKAKAAAREPPRASATCRGCLFLRGATGGAPLCKPQLSWDKVAGTSGPGSHQHLRVLRDQYDKMRTHSELSLGRRDHSPSHGKKSGTNCCRMRSPCGNINRQVTGLERLGLHCRL